MSLVRRKAAAPRFARPRLYQQLAVHITDFIEAQGLSPGDRLPPERELAVELGVSRATLAQALVALEMQGRVAVRHGDGAVVLDPAERVAAVVAALAPICAQQFRAGTEATVKLDELKKLASYEQAPYIEKGGWATMPGATAALAGVGRGCASILVDAKAA